MHLATLIKTIRGQARRLHKGKQNNGEIDDRACSKDLSQIKVSCGVGEQKIQSTKASMQGKKAKPPPKQIKDYAKDEKADEEEKGVIKSKVQKEKGEGHSTIK